MPPGSKQPHIYKSRGSWTVRVGIHYGGVFPNFRAACDAARYFSRHPRDSQRL